MKRVFLAVEISNEARHVAATHVEKLRSQFREARVSWVKPENMHITLKFLGDVGDAQIKGLSSTLERIATGIETFEVSLDKPLAFGRRTLVIGIQDTSGRFAELSRLIENECQGLEHKIENRPFHPHLTIARIRDQKGTAELIAVHRKGLIEPIKIKVDAVVLYESRLRPAGSVYSPLARSLFGRP